MSIRKILIYAAVALVTCGSTYAQQSNDEGSSARLDSFLGELALSDSKNRQIISANGFEYFLKNYVLSLQGDLFVVESDIAIYGIESLKLYHADLVNQPHNYVPRSAELQVQVIKGKKSLWPKTESKNLTYCISRKDFCGDIEEGCDEYEKVIAGMNKAAQRWEEVTIVNFIHKPKSDAKCSNTTTEVVFNVSLLPPCKGADCAKREPRAVAFYPNEKNKKNRRNRQLFVSGYRSISCAFPNEIDNCKAIPLEMMLTHELGHILGFSHEHDSTYSNSKCKPRTFETADITPFDRLSIMLKPKAGCNGITKWKNLSDLDKVGAACVYGDPAGPPDFDLTKCEYVRQW